MQRLMLSATSAYDHHRCDGENDANRNDRGLNAKDNANSVFRNPRGLEVANRKSTSRPPHINNRRDDRGLVGILFQSEGSDGPARVSLCPSNTNS